MTLSSSRRAVLAACFLLGVVFPTDGATPPVPRATQFDGSYSNIVFYPFQPWMNSNVTTTVEGWIYCSKLTGAQTLLGRHYATNLWFGLNTNRLRFYRSGGVFADSDGIVLPFRWTHVAATYDGSRVRFYTNGMLAGNKVLANSGNQGTNGLSLGGQHDVLSLGDIFASGYSFSGYLDEFRLWSVVRSSADIAGNMLAEIRHAPGLEASFGSGGGINDTRSIAGTTTGTPAAARVTGFGMVPRNLCIPYTRSPIKVDGVIDLLNEYRGAETAVVQYTNSFGGYEDHPAYLIVSTTATNSHLVVGIPSLALSGGTISTVQLLAQVNPAAGDTFGLGDWQCQLAQDGFQGGTIYDHFPFPNGAVTALGWGQSAATWQGALGSATEFSQNYEFRIQSRFLNGFTNAVNLMIRHRDVLRTGDQGAAPKTGDAARPSTWLQASWCGQADAGLRFVSISGTVTNTGTGRGESGWLVSLLSGDNELSAFRVDTETSSGAGGTFTLSGNVAKDLPIWVQIESRTDYSLLPPVVPAGSGNPPIAVRANRSVKFAACPTGSCLPGAVQFFVVPPPGPVSLSSSSVAAGAPEIVLRDSPRKVAPATVVTLFGTNLHDQLEVYLSKCSIWPPSFCTEGVDLFRMTILSNDPSHQSITVKLPENSPQFRGGMQWILKDRWVSHPGWTQWVPGPTGFNVDPLNHPYATIWGFEFQNEGDGTSLQEFESVYGENIFHYVPFPPFKIRDPYYFGVWAPVFFVLGETAGRGGSCHGMASVSRMFERGILNVANYDTPGSGGPNGVHYPAGFPSVPDGRGPQPYRPADWTGFDLFQAFRPADLWSQIRTFMMMQFSTEGIDNALDQTSVMGGDPVAVLNRLRSNPRGYILCFNPGGIGAGHCITPLGVVDDFKLNDADLAHQMQPQPGFSLIRVYDNNYPGEERLYEVDRANNQYRYLMGFRSGDPSQPVIWSGRSMFTTSIAFFTSGHTAPGLERVLLGPLDFFFRFVCSGGADALHEDATGGTWGWDAAGSFHNTFPGAATHFPLFGFNPDRDIRAGFAFLPSTHPPVRSVINVRGKSYVFHAGRLGTTFQLLASDLVPGGTDLATVSFKDQVPVGLRFEPARPIGSLVAQLAQVKTNESIVYSAQNLSVPRGNMIEWQALPGKHGARFIHQGPDALTFTFQIEGVDALTGLVCSNRFGPLTLPPGSSQTVSFPGWPDASAVQAEVDLGNDGVVDEFRTLGADRKLQIRREAGGLVIRWQNGASSDFLETRDSSNPAGTWDRVEAVPQSDPAGGWRVSVPITAESRVFRLRP